MVPSREQTDRFPHPPLTFTDADGRAVTIEVYGGAPDPLVEMYDHFSASEGAQGLPPRDEDAVREWVAGLVEDGLNVVAWHDGEAVGHAALLPYDDTAELVIFVRPDYQEASVGSRLIRGLLGHGQQNGVDHVWLSVERTNSIAISLYESVGFETTQEERAELEMERDL